MPKVTFAKFGNGLASTRLRAEIPQRELAKLGIEQGTDVLVYGKHWLDEKVIGQFDKRIYDICDNHFDNEHGDYYRTHAKNADVVTCNTEVMRDIIKRETGRDAIVIPEPYESQEGKPAIGELLLWFGHGSNIKQIERLFPLLKQPLIVLSNIDWLPKWTPENFSKAISQECIVVIPTGHKQAKSENRMVESIRCGRYVCAEYLPAYEPFFQFFPCRDIPEHIEWVLGHRKEALEAIKDAQEYIRDRYSPEAIAKKWLEVL